MSWFPTVEQRLLKIEHGLIVMHAALSVEDVSADPGDILGALEPHANDLLMEVLILRAALSDEVRNLPAPSDDQKAQEERRLKMIARKQSHTARKASAR